MKLVFVALLLLGCLAAGPVYAGCTNPAGNEADYFYNADYHTYQFCNGTVWMPFGAIGGGGGGGLTLIATQTASSSASLQFTNLPTSYNTLFLNCSGFILSNSGALTQILVGEGATPTWETGAHYSNTVMWTGNSVESPQENIATTGTSLIYMGASPTGSPPTQFKGYIDNVGSSTLYKIASFETGNGNGVSNTQYYAQSAWGYWNNDTNPVTGLEIIPSAGTITSGTCSLYGMN